MKYRFIDTVKMGVPGLFSLGMDEAILQAVAEDRVMPTIRLSTLSSSGVTVGYYQNIQDEVDVDKCKELGLPIARRLTGGGAVFQDKEIVYSVTTPLGTDLAPDDVLESYRRICDGLIKGLSLLHINAEFKPLNDIIVKGKKISGNAQTRRNGVLLQQGTILVDIDVDKMFSILKVPQEKLKSKHIEDVKQCVTSVRKEVGFELSFIDIGRALKFGFAEQWNAELEEGNLTPWEGDYAKKTIDELFANDDWNYRR